MDNPCHRVDLFLFRQRDEEPDYLLVRAEPARESFWGPVSATVRPEEDMETAAQRVLLDSCGIADPRPVTDLGHPMRWQIGDELFVEWPFAVDASHLTGDTPLRLGEALADACWDGFDGVYQRAGFDWIRSGLSRLHWHLRGGR